MDLVGSIVTGFCIGLGNGFSLWLHEKKIRKTLDNIEEKMKGMKWQ